MDIKVKDRIFYRVDPTLAEILTEAFPTVFEHVESKPRVATANAQSASIANPQKPIWGIFTAPLSGNVSISCKYLRGEHFYDGDPARAAAFSVSGHMCPLEVVDAYARAKSAGAANAPSEWKQDQQYNAAEDLIARGGATRRKAE